MTEEIKAKDPIIKVENISFCYEESEDGGEKPEKAIDSLSLEIERGSFVAVTGSNGSGKSTLAKHFNALLVPGEGRVLVDGMDSSDEESVWEIRRRVGMVFQNPDNQLVSSVAEDDVAFGAENLGVPSAEIRERVDEALKAVDMYEFRKKGAHLLSGGQKQRIAIAGILAMGPECIVLDEPTAMLDPKGRADLMEILKRLNARGKTIILITHFMEEAAQADRMIVMDRGRLAMDGAPREVFKDSERLRELKLELPFTIELASVLRSAGLEIPEGILFEEELAEAVCALK